MEQYEQLPESFTVDDAFKYCERLTKAHYENFPVGSWLIPKEKRRYVYSIYAFARTADDFADEHSYDHSQRFPLLDRWERKLEECYQGQITHPIFLALHETIRQFEIPIDLPRALITAFKMDVIKNRYKTFSDLLYYCRHSANPIGRLVLLLFGYRDPYLHELSDAICTALQLTNHWQDIAIDLQKDRIYLPEEDMARFGYSEEELFLHTLNEPFKALMRYEAEQTEALFDKGVPLLSQVGKDLQFELKLTWLGGTTILKRIEANGYDVFSQRPVISILDKMALLWTALMSKIPRRM